MSHETDIIKVSKELTLMLSHARASVVMIKESHEPCLKSCKMDMTIEDFKTMVAQYLLLRHMERMKEVSTDQLLEAISIDL